MSCIAVHMHCIKDDVVVRLQLMEKLDGKNGKTQVGKWMDLDTKKLVTEYTVPGPGIFHEHVIMKGHKIKPIGFGSASGMPGAIFTPIISCACTDMSSWQHMQYAAVTCYTLAIPSLVNFGPDSILEHCYFSIKRIS